MWKSVSSFVRIGTSENPASSVLSEAERCNGSVGSHRCTFRWRWQLLFRYISALQAASASPMTIWAGKQMSLWTYFFPRRIASSRRQAAAPRGVLLSHGCRHDAAEGMGRCSEPGRCAVSSRSFLYFTGYGSGGVNLYVLMFLPLHADRFNKGADTDPQRSLDLTLVEL